MIYDKIMIFCYIQGVFFTVPPLEMAKCQITQKVPSKKVKSVRIL